MYNPLTIPLRVDLHHNVGGKGCDLMTKVTQNERQGFVIILVMVPSRSSHLPQQQL